MLVAVVLGIGAAVTHGMHILKDLSRISVVVLVCRRTNLESMSSEDWMSLHALVRYNTPQLS
mgnify:CR=1 FL=1